MVILALNVSRETNGYSVAGLTRIAMIDISDHIKQLFHVKHVCDHPQPQSDHNGQQIDSDDMMW